MVNKINFVKKELKKYSSKRKAKILSGFFKTGPGQYGEGDVFIGVTLPDIRKVANKHQDLTLEQVQSLLDSKIHEQRLLALLILLKKFESADVKRKSLFFSFYTKNVEFINNWDLVDLTAPKIVGDFLLNKDKKLLYKWANSNDLWKKRIAIVSTYRFIKNKSFEHTLAISQLLLGDKNDLIHKAVGWMLREVGKMSLETEEEFLKKFYKNMPRTMLRYAIEKFPNSKRDKYLNALI
jgi:3-methyladenine DNA glycosylase AlkD